MARLYGVTSPFMIKRAVFVLDAAGIIRWKHVSSLGLTYQDVDTLTGVIRQLTPTN